MGTSESAPPHWLHPHFIEAENLLRFERFMELCLYDEENGYYARNINSVGSGGDFSTTPSLSPVLAIALSQAITSSGLRDVIEIGPGAGDLASQLLLQLRPSALSFRKRIRYHLVERSAPLRALLKQRLGRSVKFHPDMQSALKVTGGTAFIISNELVDAFPVRVFQGARGAIHELFLSLKGGSLVEEWVPASELPDSTQFNLPRDPKQRLEIHHSYRIWIDQWLPSFQNGKLVTIDYGGSGAEVYYRKPQGTLRAYYHHEHLTGPDIYRLCGRQDLTADVNFEDLIYWGEQSELSTTRLASQHDYCQAHQGRVTGTQEARFLTDPAGAGNAFKILEQERSGVGPVTIG